MREKITKLMLEDYEEFLVNPKQSKLTNTLLNQIVSIHGFKKLHHSPKEQIVNALSSIDLMSPLRSTLKENISSSAFLTRQEVNEDLALLGWQECPVQSIETLKQSSNDQKALNEYPLLLSSASTSDLSHSRPKKSTMEMESRRLAKKPRSERKRYHHEKANEKIDSVAPSDHTTSSGPSIGSC